MEQFLLLSVPDAWPASSSLSVLLARGSCTEHPVWGSTLSCHQVADSACFAPSAAFRLKSPPGAPADHRRTSSPTSSLTTSSFVSFKVLMVRAILSIESAFDQKHNRWMKAEPPLCSDFSAMLSTFQRALFTEHDSLQKRGSQPHSKWESDPTWKFKPRTTAISVLTVGWGREQSGLRLLPCWVWPKHRPVRKPPLVWKHSRTDAWVWKGP